MLSKVETIDHILDSALEIFSRFGFDGASLREIAAGAGVPLSAIDMYFGSKAQLYSAVEQHAWAAIRNERKAMLLAASAAGTVDLRSIIYALAYPIVRRSVAGTPLERRGVVLVREGVRNWTPTRPEDRRDTADRGRATWIHAIGKACPALSWNDSVWAYAFVMSAIYSWQLTEHFYDHLLNDGGATTVDEVIQDLVEFCCGGVQALVKRRSEAGGVG